MKNFTLVVYLCISVSSFAQFRHISFNLNNDVSNTLEKVVEDFPNHFNNIRGSVIDEDIQSINYSSNVNIEQADSAIIIQTGNEKDNVFSWKETVFSGDDFDEVKAKFHTYFNKIKNTSANVNGKNVSFTATYETPDDSKQFTSILFTQHAVSDALKNVVIDLSLHYLLDSWQISIAVYEHRDYGVNDDAEAK